MIPFTHLKYTFVAATCMGLLISCGAKDSDKIGEAQLCLDKAVQGAAAGCMEKISGIESKGAYTLRCSAGFIDEGFTQPARFKSAFDALSTSGGLNTEAFFGVLAFNSKANSTANKNFASETYLNCTKSEAKGMMLLGSMATTATTLAALAVGGPYVNGAQPTPAQINGALTAALGDPVALAAIGSAVSTTYTASCLTGTKADAALCSQLDSALGPVDITNPTAVANAILTYWKNN
ncbi:MAG: hypothetical protein H7326_04275 [Bdellovibrionaceae bacterium]|nr:hypothetical protein [Pseudobdellovibrionaceae bacterium]